MIATLLIFALCWGLSIAVAALTLFIAPMYFPVDENKEEKQND